MELEDFHKAHYNYTKRFKIMSIKMLKGKIM
jgi:hypothetical protein